MPKRRSKRSSYLSLRYLSLDTRPIKIWGYDTSDEFVCRLEINAAGVAVYSGKRGGKKLCNHDWETFVGKLTKRKQ